MKKSVLFVINPISGTRRKVSIPGEIEKHLDHSLFDYQVRYTEHAGHAAEIAGEAARQGVDIVVAVGGDGTVNEVARSLVHTNTALGIIPCGSGNGLARHLQIPQSARGAIEILNCNLVHCLDYGKLNGLPFFCTCGVGFDAFVSQKFADSGHRGLLQYAKNTIGVGLKYKAEKYIIEHDGVEEEVEAWLIACANASQYGNNAFIAPTASMKDGLMDVIIMSPFPTIEGAYVLLQMFTKTLLNNNHVRLFKTNKIRIRRADAGPVHCDGDPLKLGESIEVELVSHGLNVMVNPRAHDKKKNYLQDMGERLEKLFGFGSSNEAESEEKQEPEQEVDPYNLQRFVEAQEGCYADALSEVESGRKQTHWMWFIFPQAKGLGRSSTAAFYGITCREEAEQYLSHPVLGARLVEITEALLKVEGRTSFEIFGSVDSRKLRSCMTLFSAISEEGNVFEQVLNKYYNGVACAPTLDFIAKE